MEFLPPEEWLSEAQRLPVGRRKRVRHNFESDCAMVVGHDSDEWWAYCHRCHESGKVQKTHQFVRSGPQEAARVAAVPADTIHISNAGRFEQQRIWNLLISKGISPGIIPEDQLWYSRSTTRIVLRYGSQGLGRALSPGQTPKWVQYGRWAQQGMWIAQYAGETAPVLVVEDALSAYKVAYAMRDCALTVATVLGTRMTPDMLVFLVNNQTKDLLCMFDGDRAGDRGMEAFRTRSRPFGIRLQNVPVPRGLDPKDLQVESIRELLRDYL